MSGRAWSLISVDDTARQYAGNTGYPDKAGYSYSYDSMVGNSTQLSKGDLVLIRSSSQVHGFAIIESIEGHKGEKSIIRCPDCIKQGRSGAGPKKRKTRPLPWRCQDGHEFLTPVETLEQVTFYLAHFENTYRTLNTPIEVGIIKSFALRPSDQASIEELDLRKALSLLSKIDKMAAGSVALITESAISLPDQEGPGNQEPGQEGYQPNPLDQRRKVLRDIHARQGQKAFRHRLIKRYGGRCMLSGCEILEIVDAAHIWPYLGPKDNHPDNGLLLRTDLHTLFDLHILAFEPGTLIAHFGSEASGAGYAHLEGMPLDLSEAGLKRPSSTCLEDRWSAFQLKQA